MPGDAPETERYEIEYPEAEVDAQFPRPACVLHGRTAAEVRSQYDVEAELDAIDAIEVGRKGDGSIANVLDKGEHEV